MKFLEYSNTNHCNIIPQEEFESLTQEVFKVIADNLCKSLGPLGSSATILDGMLTEATKDGYSILRKYRFHNRYKKMIYNLIMAPCTRMNNTVGDGTTTAIALTNALYNCYKSQKNELGQLYRLPRQFTQAWNECIEDVTKRITEKAVPINPEDYDTIYNIAYVTSNGSHEISDAIASVYRDAKSPSIKQKDSPTNKSYISPINGYDFPANLISDAFVRNQDLSVNENDIHVMIFDHKIETDFFMNVILPLNAVFRAMGSKLLILAHSYDAYMCETVVDQNINAEYRQYGYINLILAQFELGKLAKHQLVDLATILRGKVITQDLAALLLDSVMKDPGNIDKTVDMILNDCTYEMFKFIGSASSASLSCTNGSIFRVDDIEDEDQYIDTLLRARRDLEEVIATTEKEKQSYASKIYEAKARISRLEMKTFIYYIGADSELQKNIIWDSVEDVIKCVRSAIKYGVVPGCQLSVATACAEAIVDIANISPEDTDAEINSDRIKSDSDKLKVAILAMIYSAVAGVYKRILHGAEGMGMTKLVDGWNTATTDEEAEEIRNKAIIKANEIVEESLKLNKVFNLETLEYDSNIITSAETDTMVLSAASELVKILISGNQCIFLDSDVNESHNETVEAYV